MARLFLALPCQAVAPMVVAWRSNSGWPGRWVTAENLHLTLRYLGETAPEVEAQLCQLLPALMKRHAPFTLTLNQSGWFPKAKVGWIGTTADYAPLTDLVNELSELLTALLERPFADSFTPHITLSRATHTLPPPLPISWQLEVREIVLYESVSTPNGVSYRKRQVWVLTES